jgi:hypothetical protein
VPEHDTSHDPQKLGLVEMFLQKPPQQSSPSAQTMPQAPQLLSSVWRSAQPLEQQESAPQLTVQELQKAGPIGSQLPLQRMKPAGQLQADWHTPLQHTWPTAHWLLQDPQRSGLDWVSRQLPLQQDSPAAHCVVQSPQRLSLNCTSKQNPLQHLEVALQGFPHAPQLSSSDCRLLQLPRQQVSCGLQDFWQVPQ